MLVMIAFNENLPAIEPFKNGKTFARNDYIAEMVDSVFFPYCCIPIVSQAFRPFLQQNQMDAMANHRAAERTSFWHVQSVNLR